MYKSIKMLLVLVVTLPFLSDLGYAEIAWKEPIAIEIHKKMIEGRRFYLYDERDSFYIMAHFKKIDPVELFGEVDYIMLASPLSYTGSAETVSYKIKNGKLLIYGNDGSIERLSLSSLKLNRWILFVEEDVMGEGKQFSKKGKEIWYLKKPKGYPPLEKCTPVDMECVIDKSTLPHSITK